ncbi:hypothetical protein MSAN_01212700 [Mycena sanguinolenta]|uniref:Phosphatidylglycerol/phosphatidylinositol transfer protein n=1 Tax=Mycena sanguinolenta TaxID=230812 RepID=A0A8H7D464_9AGAR|nr:hypothetical protein MSAN_01212700 [Mycena sanguinolenta]
MVAVAFAFRSLLLLASLSFTQAGFLADVGQQLRLSAAGDMRTTMASWSYDDCGTPEDVLQLQSLEITPDPPQPGQNLTVQVKATAVQRIENGAFADVTVKLGLIKILTKRFDLCKEARNAGTSVQCPVEPGDYVVEQTVALPKEIPPAKFTVAIRAYTADENDMMCVDIKADFMKR